MAHDRWCVGPFVIGHSCVIGAWLFVIAARTRKNNDDNESPPLSTLARPISHGLVDGLAPSPSFGGDGLSPQDLWGTLLAGIADLLHVFLRPISACLDGSTGSGVRRPQPGGSGPYRPGAGRANPAHRPAQGSHEPQRHRLHL